MAFNALSLQNIAYAHDKYTELYRNFASVKSNVDTGLIRHLP